VRPRTLVGVAALTLIGVLAACRSSIARRSAHPNILLITIDTLRADHIGAYGYPTALTPSLDALARRGLRFDNAATMTPLTLPAHSSLMTGTFPAYHGVRDNAGFVLSHDHTTLADALRARGYRTGGFVAAFVLDHRWGLDKGFDLYSDHFDRSKYAPDVGLDEVQRPGHEVVDEAIGWLNQDIARPFLAWVHLYEPHAPYTAPQAIRARFPPTTIGGYDAEIATADQQVGRLLNALAAQNRLDRTIVAVLGDHGEGLGEHQEQEHGFFVYESTIRIPLIVAGPGLPSGAIHDQVRIVDVMPTLLDLATIDIPPAAQGRSLLPLARGERMPLPAVSETWYPRQHFGWSELAAIRDGRYKLIAAPRRELYDLQADPGETHDLASSDAARADALERELHEILGKTSSRKPASEARPIDPKTAERLRSLGYVAGTVSSQGRTAAPRADPKDKIALYNLLKRAADESVQGRSEDAIATVRRALGEDPSIVEGYTMLGEYLRKSNRDDEAIAAFERALGLDPHGTKSAWQLAELLMGRGQFGRAESVLERAVADALDPPAFLTKIAECQIELRRYDEAERRLREALQEKPDQAGAHYDLGLIYEARGDGSRAIAEYESELQRNPTMAGAHVNIGRLLGAAGRREEAMRHFESAVQANPRFGSGYVYLAKARLDAGDFTGAEAAAKQGISLDLDPRIAPLGHYVLADVYNRLGRPQEAAREAAAGRQLERKRQ
jgi:arylsulfatase A-like enzyme/Tfp pilus assembly protein PilF